MVIFNAITFNSWVINILNAIGFNSWVINILNAIGFKSWVINILNAIGFNSCVLVILNAIVSIPGLLTFSMQYRFQFLSFGHSQCNRFQFLGLQFRFYSSVSHSQCIRAQFSNFDHPKCNYSIEIIMCASHNNFNTLIASCAYHCALEKKSDLEPRACQEIHSEMVALVSILNLSCLLIL